MGAIKKTGSAIKRGARWWAEGWTKPVATIVPAETRSRFGAYKRLYAYFLETVRRGKSGWKTRPQIRMSYEEMLDTWGIRRNEVPYVMRKLRQGRWLAIVLSILAFATTAWQFSNLQWQGLVSFLLMIMIAINGAIISWKFSCLAQQRYEEFFEWMGFPRQVPR